LIFYFSFNFCLFFLLDNSLKIALSLLFLDLTFFL
jgi:hypothetical protein